MVPAWLSPTDSTQLVKFLLGAPVSHPKCRAGALQYTLYQCSSMLAHMWRLSETCSFKEALSINALHT